MLKKQYVGTKGGLGPHTISEKKLFYIYIYIYRERERERERDIYIYIYIYI